MKLLSSKPSTQVLIKFLLLCVLLLGYFLYLTYRYDLLTGGIGSLLTWSFFVLCTPIADAGFLLDFPLRILFGIRMVISEIAVWIIAFGMNGFSLLYGGEYYQVSVVTKLLHQILVTPYPYWAVILISATGTFISVIFGDELFNVVRHHDRKIFNAHHFKYELILIVFFLVVVFGYFELIASLGIEDKI